jgi:hypothetical protein
MTTRSLRDVQVWMHGAITSAERPADVADYITAGPRLDASGRFDVHREGYVARLEECLADDYPLLSELLGHQAFHALCHRFLARHPSRSPNLNYFGRPMAAFCREDTTLGEHALAAAEIATLEWSIVEVLHAQAAAPIAPSALQEIPPEEWGGLRLVPSDAVRLLRFEHAVNAAYQAFRDDEGTAWPAREKTTTVVYRSELSIWRMSLTPPMTRVLEALLAKKTLEESLSAIEVDETDEAAVVEASQQVMVWFREWMSSGMFGGIERPLRPLSFSRARARARAPARPERKMGPLQAQRSAFRSGPGSVGVLTLDRERPRQIGHGHGHGQAAARGQGGGGRNGTVGKRKSFTTAMCCIPVAPESAIIAGATSSSGV